MPLVLTLTIATAGVAAWAWSQRKDAEEENDHEPDLDYENADYGDNPPYGSSRDYRPPPNQGGPPPQQPGPDGYQAVTDGPGDPSQAGWGARMSGALRRTPSPQQFFDSAGKTVAGGVAAAGAVMGKALASIREEDKQYGDRNPWSEEADAKKDRSVPASGKRRKTVALIVSADSKSTDFPEDGFQEHASILSHIPRHNDFAEIKLFVLIYAPGLKDTGADTATSNLPPPSLASSYSNIGHDQAQTPGDEAKNPMSLASSSPEYNAVYSQALNIVEKESMILPFTSSNGHVHILRHLSPEVIYLQQSLAGDNGSIVTNLQTWLRHDIILVVGAESGSGGLADSESEAERTTKVEQWWQKPERVGRGRGVIVVDGMRVADDWAKRVQGKD